MIGRDKRGNRLVLGIMVNTHSPPILHFHNVIPLVFYNWFNISSALLQ